MIKNITKLLILICLLFGLPASGVILSGQSIDRFLEFPPKTYYVQHASFSWTAFVIITIMILIGISPFLISLLRYLKRPGMQSLKAGKMPLWGKLGLLSMAFFWISAWSPIGIISGFKNYTFPFIWLSYIITINSLQYRNTGKCLMLRHPGKFLLLFPVSAVFWWYFEYINEFVRNWYYIGDDYTTLKFITLSTVSFSTVLPAIASTGELLAGKTWFREGFKNILPVKIPASMPAAFVVLIISSLGLFGLPVYPDYLFPFVWISPVLIMVSMQTFFKERHILSGIAEGNWSRVASASLAALTCGIFWEMWNFYSLPKWKYSIPLVQRFHIFEMPLLGYAGYLPFGLFCLSVIMLLDLNDEYF